MAKRVFIDLPKGTIDETGHKYGYLTVREFSETDPNQGAMWWCECECGQPKCPGRVKAAAKRLRIGRSISCGQSRANPDIRQAARMKMPAKRRREIARLGGEARCSFFAPSKS